MFFLSRPRRRAERLQNSLPALALGLIVLLVLVLSFLSPQFPRAPTASPGITGAAVIATSACGNLDTPNSVYELTGNVATTTTCFNVTADNVTLDCKGFRISGDAGGSPDDLAVNFSGRANVTVQNCVIRDVSTAVNAPASGSGFVGPSYNLTFRNLSLAVSFDGFHLSDAHGVWIEDVTLWNAGNTFHYLRGGSTNVTVRHALAYNSSFGYWLEDVRDYYAFNATARFNEGNNCPGLGGCYAIRSFPSSANNTNVTFDHFNAVNHSFAFIGKDHYGAAVKNSVFDGLDAAYCTAGLSLGDGTPGVLVGGTNPPADLLVDNVTLRNCAYGLAHGPSDNTSVTGLSVHDTNTTAIVMTAVSNAAYRNVLVNVSNASVASFNPKNASFSNVTIAGAVAGGQDAFVFNVSGHLTTTAGDCTASMYEDISIDRPGYVGFVVEKCAGQTIRNLQVRNLGGYAVGGTDGTYGFYVWSESDNTRVENASVQNASLGVGVFGSAVSLGGFPPTFVFLVPNNFTLAGFNLSDLGGYFGVGLWTNVPDGLNTYQNGSISLRNYSSTAGPDLDLDLGNVQHDLVNVTYNKTAVRLTGSAALLNTSWFARVNVTDEALRPVSNASVNITDANNLGADYANLLTDAAGLTGYVTLTEYTQNSTQAYGVNESTNNPHNASATGSFNASLYNVTESTTLHLILPLNVASYAFAIATPALVGSEHSLTLTAVDSQGNAHASPTSVTLSASAGNTNFLFINGVSAASPSCCQVTFTGTTTLKVKYSFADPVTLTATDANGKTGSISYTFSVPPSGPSVSTRVPQPLVPSPAATPAAEPTPAEPVTGTFTERVAIDSTTVTGTFTPTRASFVIDYTAPATGFTGSLTHALPFDYADYENGLIQLSPAPSTVAPGSVIATWDGLNLRPFEAFRVTADVAKVLHPSILQQFTPAALQPAATPAPTPAPTPVPTPAPPLFAADLDATTTALLVAILLLVAGAAVWYARANGRKRESTDKPTH